MTTLSNKPDAVNPAMTLRLTIDDQWSRVTDLGRWFGHISPVKRPALIVIAIAALFMVGAISSFIAYRAGQRHSLGLQKGTLVGTLSGLEDIRRGDIQGGTRRIESLCFMSAVVLMADEHYQADFAVRTFTPTLVSYRQIYRTNQADWTPTEQRLESLLTQTR